jgi:hypothetical protein
LTHPICTPAGLIVPDQIRLAADIVAAGQYLRRDGATALRHFFKNGRIAT